MQRCFHNQPALFQNIFPYVNESAIELHNTADYNNDINFYLMHIKIRSRNIYIWQKISKRTKIVIFLIIINLITRCIKFLGLRT